MLPVVMDTSPKMHHIQTHRSTLFSKVLFKKKLLVAQIRTKSISVKDMWEEKGLRRGGETSLSSYASYDA